MDTHTANNRAWLKRNLIPLIIGALAGGIVGWFSHAMKVSIAG